MIALRRLKSGAPDFAAQLAALLAFEGAQDAAVDTTVAGILDDVKKRGDAAVLALPVGQCTQEALQVPVVPIAT